MKINPSKYAYTLIPIALFFFTIAILAPLSGDDWSWGSAIGRERLATWFYDYNGRYVGNLIVMILTRSDILRVIVETLVNVGIVLASVKVVWNFTKSEKASIAVLVMFGLALLPVRVWGQTFLWTSGFSNYNTTTLFVLVNILVFQSLFLKQEKVEVKENPKLKTILCVGLFALFTFLAQMILENISIFIIGFSFVVLAVALFKKEKIMLAFSQLIGALAGAAVMFSNPTYFGDLTYGGLFEGDPGFRRIGYSPFQNLIDVWQERVIHFLFFDASLIFLLLSIVLYLVFNKTLLQKVLSTFAVAFMALCFAWPLLTGHNNVSAHTGINFAISVAGILFLLCIAVLLLTHEQHFPALLYAAGIVILIPVLIQTTFGPRNFLTSFVLFILVAIILLLDKYEIPLRKLSIFAVITVAILGLLTFGVYRNNRTIANRQTQIQAGLECLFRLI